MKKIGMRKLEKAIWVMMHVVCICVLVFCVWKNGELFPETSVSGEEHTPGGDSEVPAGAFSSGSTAEGWQPTAEEGGQPAQEGQPQDPDASIEGQQAPAANVPIGEEVIPEPTKLPNVEENAEPVKDQMGDGLLAGTPMQKEEVPEEPKKRYAKLRAEIEENIAQGVYAELDNTQHDWWFARKKDHVPSGSGEELDISPYDAYYRNKDVSEEDKVIYLTFDCGYENGFTPRILDTLAAHGAKAMFFVTKAFIESCPDYVIRMKEEGHLVGNHTLNHPAMPAKGEETLMDEILGCAELFYETTGYEIDPFLRPPMGAYSERTLKLTKDLGYKTVFWSIAYKDYDINNQPGKDYVTEHFATYYHNGAIPLIHNISRSNTEALDEVMTMLEKAGYRFGSLTELK